VHQGEILIATEKEDEKGLRKKRNIYY